VVTRRRPRDQYELFAHMDSFATALEKNRLAIRQHGADGTSVSLFPWFQIGVRDERDGQFPRCLYPRSNDVSAAILSDLKKKSVPLADGRNEVARNSGFDGIIQVRSFDVTLRLSEVE